MPKTCMKNSKETCREIYADVLVVGSGAAGLSAAICAQKLGLSVSIIEKMPFPGGYSRFCEGIFAVESSIQKERNVNLKKEDIFKNHMKSTFWRADATLVQTFINQSAQHIDWLQDMGVEFKDLTALSPEGPKTWHIFQGGGAAFIDTLIRQVSERNIKLLLNTALTAFKTSNNGDISGVIAMNNKGETIDINSKAIILASGGYASNSTLLKQRTNLPFEIKPVIDFAQTGEPIQCAWDIGAATNGNAVLLAIPCVDKEKPDSHLWTAGVQPALWINKNGSRFCDETIFFEFPISANALSNQPGGEMYCIFDEAHKKEMIETGVPIGLGAFVPPHTKLTRLEQSLQRGFENGTAFSDKTISGLAQKIGANAQLLGKTINQYNSCCQNQYDDQFNKNPEYLKPIEAPRYFAIKCNTRLFTTLGGIRINPKTEVVDTSDNVIPGLYATGNCADGMYGSDYEVLTAGGALGFAVHSGITAANSSAGYIKNQD